MNRQTALVGWPVQFSTWVDPPEKPDFPVEEVHVWRLFPDPTLEDLEKGSEWLSTEELKRAAGFYRATDKAGFIITHVALRVILAAYLGTDARELRFEKGPKGKPALASPYAYSGLSFNLAHSHGIGVIGVAAGREIGVDVEFIRPEPAIKSIERRFFSNRESEFIAAAPPEKRQEAFFTIWTLREAYMKATGEGFTVPQDTFEFELEAGRNPKLVLDPPGASPWLLLSIIPAPGYLGALAVQGKNTQAYLWNWSPSSLIELYPTSKI